MPTIVRSGGGGTDVSDATASASQVLTGYSFYGNGSDELQEGTMANYNAAQVGLSGTSNAGYYSSITVNTSGFGNASAEHVLSGRIFVNNSGSQQGTMNNFSSKTTINVGETGSAGYYSSIAINKSSLGNASSAQVLNTVTFTNNSGTTQQGTMNNHGALSVTLGYGGSTTGNGAGYYSSISVTAPGRYGTATQAHVLNNVSFMNSTGNYSKGSIATYGDTTQTIDPGNSWSGAGYYKSIKVTANAATYSGNATASVVRSGYTFMNSSGGPYTGSFTPAASYVCMKTKSVNSKWTSVTFDFTPTVYAVGWNDEDWNSSTTTYYGLKHYQSGATISFCKEGSNTTNYTARIVAYA